MADSYFAVLYALHRARRDNPVAMATTPWRGTLRRRIVFWSLLAAVTATSLLGGWLARHHAHSWGHLFGYYGAFIAIPLFTALSLQLFGFRHRLGGELEDLALTRLTRREVVFGAVYGPVLASGCFALAILAGYALAAAAVAGVFWYRLAVLVLLWVAMVGVAVRAWILSFGSAFHVIVYTTAFAVGFFLLSAMQQISPAWAWLILLVLAFGAAGLLKAAGRFAGLRFFAPLDWEALCRAYWLTNELVAFFEFAERRAAFRRLRREYRVKPIDLLGGWLAGLLILWAFCDFVGSELAQAAPFPSAVYPFICRIGDPLGIVTASLASTVVALGIRIRRQGGVLWMPAGSIHVSMISHIWIPLLPFISLAIAAGIAAHAAPALPVSPWRFFAGCGLGCFFSGAVFLLAARAHSPGNVCAFAGLVVLGFLAFLFLGGFAQPLFSELLVIFFLAPAAPAADAFHGLLRWEKTVLTLLGFASAVLLALWPRLCQSIHDRSMKQAPRHAPVPLGTE